MAPRPSDPLPRPNLCYCTLNLIYLHFSYEYRARSGNILLQPVCSDKLRGLGGICCRECEKKPSDSRMYEHLAELPSELKCYRSSSKLSTLRNTSIKSNFNISRTEQRVSKNHITAPSASAAPCIPIKDDSWWGGAELASNWKSAPGKGWRSAQRLKI
jgi:hypothetical protein